MLPNEKFRAKGLRSAFSTGTQLGDGDWEASNGLVSLSIWMRGEGSFERLGLLSSRV